MIKILFLGDVVGKTSCEHIRKELPKLKNELKPDITIINGENSADGNGITPFSAKHLFSSGADVITGGNHTLKRKEVYDLLDTDPFMTRPYNITSAVAGKGIIYYDMGYTSVAIINLSGTVYMEPAENPFAVADKLVNEATENGAKVIIIDFHAEATSEKNALGLFLDGKASAVIGTHTHIQTSDAKILPNGTGYITDVGMCGPVNSVLGVESSIIIKRFMGDFTEKFIVSSNPVEINGCFLTVDEKTGKCISMQSIKR